MPDWRRLARLPDAELAKLDIAVVSLSCAEGLPGVDEIDLDYGLYKLDDWALAVREYTARLMPQFRRGPHESDNSAAYFRTRC